jgi:hypothetical protein
MTRFFRILLILLCTEFAVSAQPSHDKVEMLRIAFITKRVEMSPAESEKFWPVYNEYNDKIKYIRKNLRQGYRKLEGSFSEQEAEEVFQLDVRSRQAEADVHRLYSDKIKTIIGAKRFIRLRIAEEEFKKEMIRALD